MVFLKSVIGLICGIYAPPFVHYINVIMYKEQENYYFIIFTNFFLPILRTSPHINTWSKSSIDSFSPSN